MRQACFVQTQRLLSYKSTDFVQCVDRMASKGESGGYIVLAVDSNIPVKASDVFRNNFAGKINRQANETALGA
jgi:hypothetical protein